MRDLHYPDPRCWRRGHPPGRHQLLPSSSYFPLRPERGTTVRSVLLSAGHGVVSTIAVRMVRPARLGGPGSVPFCSPGFMSARGGVTGTHGHCGPGLLMWPTSKTGPKSQGKPYLITYGAGMTMQEGPPGAELGDAGLPPPPAGAFRVNEMGIRLGTVANIEGQARGSAGPRLHAVRVSHFRPPARHLQTLSRATSEVEVIQWA